MKRIRLKATTLVLVMLCLMYMITYVDRVNISTAAGQFKFQLGLTNAQLGLVFSAYAYPYVVCQFIGGWVSDRFGAKRTLICCSLIWATALTGLAGGFATLIAARLLLGLGEGATFPAATTAMATWFAKDKRGMAQGITHSSARLGNAIAPILVYADQGVQLALLVLRAWIAEFGLGPAMVRQVPRRPGSPPQHHASRTRVDSSPSRSPRRSKGDHRAAVLAHAAGVRRVFFVLLDSMADAGLDAALFHAQFPSGHQEGCYFYLGRICCRCDRRSGWWPAH